MAKIFVVLVALLLAGCASSPRGKLADLDEALTSAINLSALLVEQGVVKNEDKPRLKACFKVAEAAIEQSRVELLTGVDSKTSYELALKYLGVARTFLNTQEGDLNACTN